VRAEVESSQSQVLREPSGHVENWEATGRRSEEPERLRAVADQQVLRLLVVVEHHLVVLATDAALLVAAERRVRRVDVVAVGPDAAGLDAAAEPVGGVDVARPDAGAQAVERVVRQLQRLVGVRNFVTATTGPKISSWKMRMRLCPSKIVGCT
jgi:hypothetical protein